MSQQSITPPPPAAPPPPGPPVTVPLGGLNSRTQITTSIVSVIVGSLSFLASLPNRETGQMNPLPQAFGRAVGVVLFALLVGWLFSRVNSRNRDTSFLVGFCAVAGLGFFSILRTSGLLLRTLGLF